MLRNTPQTKAPKIFVNSEQLSLKNILLWS